MGLGFLAAACRRQSAGDTNEKEKETERHVERDRERETSRESESSLQGWVRLKEEKEGREKRVLARRRHFRKRDTGNRRYTFAYFADGKIG